MTDTKVNDEKCICGHGKAHFMNYCLSCLERMTCVPDEETPRARTQWLERTIRLAYVEGFRHGFRFELSSGDEMALYEAAQDHASEYLARTIG